MILGPEATLTHYDGAATRAIAEAIVVPLYEATHADQLGTPFYSSARFAERLNGYTAAQGFALVLAKDETGEPIGQAFGYPLPTGARWWQGLVSDVPEGFADEDGRRTFALTELDRFAPTTNVRASPGPCTMP